ncbi:MAG: serine/threonine protein kinase [Planctomycetales bacterium]|nr:serine/threonine protein kinase [Planctomycetales bacterium]
MDARKNTTSLMNAPAGAPAAPPLAAGQAFGGYLLVEEIGRGGMGQVFRARDLALDRLVALKVSPPDAGPAAMDRMLREARIAARLSHPAIVPVHAAGRVDGRAFLALQYVPGRSLRSLLDERGPLPPAEALRIARDAADALAAVHAAGLVHLDVKPENLLLPESGGVRLTDFGIARESPVLPAREDGGLYFGTPEYSSPEQCLGGDLDPRSDLYSLGITLYEMLVGKVPHEGDSPVEILRRIATRAPTAVEVLDPTIPGPVAAVVRKLLDRRRDSRYARAEDVVRDIGKVLGSRRLEGAAPPSRLAAGRVERPASRPAAARRPTAATQPLPRVRSRSLRRAAARAGILAAVTGGFGLVLGALLGLVRIAPQAEGAAPGPAGPPGDPAAVDAAGGPVAEALGRALEPVLGRAIAGAPAGAPRPVITVREFPASGHVMVQIAVGGASRAGFSWLTADNPGLLATATREVGSVLRAILHGPSAPAPPADTP